MRAWLFAVACLLVTACGDGSATPEATTGMTLTVQYSNRLSLIALSGTTLASNRKFGPYVVAASKLESGDTIGFTFDAGDRGSAMICGEGRDRDGVTAAGACGVFAIRAGEVTLGTLALEPVN